MQAVIRPVIGSSMGQVRFILVAPAPPPPPESYTAYCIFRVRLSKMFIKEAH
jgi:hypothetical protein